MFVYKFTSPSGSAYIGQTKQPTIEKRFKQHLVGWRRWIKDGRPRKSYQTKLYYAFDTYEPDSWKLGVLAETFDVDQLNTMEMNYIKLFNTVENGYNLQTGGQKGWTGNKLSDEHKQKQSEARKAWFLTPDGIAHKEKLSERYSGENNPAKKLIGLEPWNKGKVCPQISEGRLANPKIYTDEDRNKLSELRKKQWAEGKMDNRNMQSDKCIEARKNLHTNNIGKKYRKD